MDPIVTSVSALIVRDGCFELAINQNIILSDLVYPLMASQMEDEMRNLPSLTAVLFHGCYTWCIMEGDSDLMNKVRSHVSKKILKCTAWPFLAGTFFAFIVNY